MDSPVLSAHLATLPPFLNSILNVKENVTLYPSIIPFQLKTKILIIKTHQNLKKKVWGGNFLKQQFKMVESYENKLLIRLQEIHLIFKIFVNNLKNTEKTDLLNLLMTQS